MSQNYRLLFVHGWGFSKNFWSPLVDFLQDYSVDYIDLGYFSDSQTADDILINIKNNQDHIIAIGHSLGFMYLLKQYPLKFHHYLAINSFLRFSRAEDFVSGIPLRILQRMSKGIDKDAFVTLSQFYTQCQYDDKPSIPINKIQLKKGLEWLEHEDYRRNISDFSKKLTVISSDKDPVVSKEMTVDSFQNHSIQWIEDRTHILPITKPNLCAKIIRSIS